MAEEAIAEETNSTDLVSFPVPWRRTMEDGSTSARSVGQVQLSLSCSAVPIGLHHSSRNAVAGSTLVARQAGATHAVAAVSAATIGTTANVSGSDGATG